MKNFPLFALLLMLLITACGKNSDIFTPQNEVPDLKGNINNFYLALRKTVPVEEFTINNNSENVVSTSTGVRLVVPMSTFTDSSQNVISGEVKVRITQLAKKSDFIKFSQFSNTSDLVLDWFKNINIEAFASNGQRLFVKNDNAITVQIPVTSVSSSWKIFNGTYYSTRQFQVLPNEYSSIKNALWKDGGAGTIVEGIEFQIKKTGWVCIASPVKTENKPQVEIGLPTSFRSFNTMLTAVYKTGNVIYEFDGSNQVENIYTQRIHNLENIRFISVSDQKDSYFAVRQDFDVFENTNRLNLSPQKSGLSEIEKLLENLD